MAPPTSGFDNALVEAMKGIQNSVRQTNQLLTKNTVASKTGLMDPIGSFMDMFKDALKPVMTVAGAILKLLNMLIMPFVNLLLPVLIPIIYMLAPLVKYVNMIMRPVYMALMQAMKTSGGALSTYQTSMKAAALEYKTNPTQGLQDMTSATVTLTAALGKAVTDALTGSIGKTAGGVLDTLSLLTPIGQAKAITSMILAQFGFKEDGTSNTKPIDLMEITKNAAFKFFGFDSGGQPTRTSSFLVDTVSGIAKYLGLAGVSTGSFLTDLVSRIGTYLGLVGVKTSNFLPTLQTNIFGYLFPGGRTALSFISDIIAKIKEILFGTNGVLTPQALSNDISIVKSAMDAAGGFVGNVLNSSSNTGKPESSSTSDISTQLERIYNLLNTQNTTQKIELHITTDTGVSKVYQFNAGSTGTNVQAIL